MVVVVIAISAFVAVMLIALVAGLLLHQKERQAVLEAKVKDFSGIAAYGIGRAAARQPSEEAPGLLARVTTYLGNLVKPQKKDEVSLLQKRFLRAGLRSHSTLVTFFGAKALCGLCLSTVFIAALLLFRLHVPTLTAMMLLIVFSFAGFYAPNMWLSMRTSRRRESFLRSFPDALDLLVVCVEAGMGLDGAIKRVGEEMSISSKVLSEEFGLLNLEMRAGKDRKDAMKDLADRINLDEVNTWVNLLIQTDRFGTGIAQALRVHSDSMRTKRVQHVEEIASRLPVKLLFPTILFIFPSFFLVILGPAMIRVWRIWSGG